MVSVELLSGTRVLLAFTRLLLTCNGLSAIEKNSVYTFAIDYSLKGVAIKGICVGFFRVKWKKCGGGVPGGQTKDKGSL